MEGLRTEPESSGSWGAAAARDGDAEALLIDMLPLVTVLKGADASFQLPRFLEKIESKVKRRLESQGLAKKEPCMERLHIYREAFDFIINSFKSYAPLLSSIKHEYDEVLNYYRLLSRELQPAKVVLGLAYIFS
ncbi:Translin-associated factor X-interacting protein 1 [Sparganum proliferum]